MNWGHHDFIEINSGFGHLGNEEMKKAMSKSELVELNEDLKVKVYTLLGYLEGISKIQPRINHPALIEENENVTLKAKELLETFMKEWKEQ